MLRASVSLSRKFIRDFHSTGYSVSLDGEVPHPPDDADAVLEKVGELFHLAEEALAVEIERDQSCSRRDENSPPQPPQTCGHPYGTTRPASLPINRPPSGGGQRPANGASTSPQAATPKQLQYLQNLGKRKGLSRDDLDAVVAQVLGAPKKSADLTKREAGAVIDHLTALEAEAAR